MLNVINGAYPPQEGTIIVFRGAAAEKHGTHEAAEHGIARTFQNIALFRGMTVLDNIMTGRNLKMKASFVEQALLDWPARAKSWTTARRWRDHRLPEIQHGKTPVGTPRTACRSGSSSPARWPHGTDRMLLLDEPMAGMNVEEKQDMCRFILDVNDSSAPPSC